MAAFTTSVWELSRQLYAKLQPDDVVVADSAYGTYLDLTLVRLANADALRERKRPLRSPTQIQGWTHRMSVNIMPVTVIFAPCKKLGIGDHIVRWQRPQRCPTSIRPEDFAALPTSIEVREVHLLIQQPGFRPKEIILVTTLLESKRYPKARLAKLYQLRWLATEVNFKHLAHHPEDGDDLGENATDGAKRNLGTNACL